MEEVLRRAEVSHDNHGWVPYLISQVKTSSGMSILITGSRFLVLVLWYTSLSFVPSGPCGSRWSLFSNVSTPL